MMPEGRALARERIILLIGQGLTNKYIESTTENAED